MEERLRRDARSTSPNMTVVMKNIIGGMSQPTFCASTSGRKRTYRKSAMRR